MLSRRLQILLDEERYDRIDRIARRRGVAVAVVVREAIDLAFPSHDAARARAGREILAAEPMPVPDLPELLAELDNLRAGGR